MEKKNGFWRSVNPTLAQMTEKNPDLSILGIWWAFTWRIFLAEVVIGAAFMLIAFLIGIAVGGR
jgi:hypothetical protein